MKAHYLLVAATLVATPALAQTSNPPSAAPNSPAAAPSATTTTPATNPNNPGQVGQWRASKLIGVDVYNQQNEKLGEINELIIAKSGQVAGAVIGVGGFLGMGERDVMVTMDKLTFATDPGSTTGSSAGDKKWYPDKTVLNTNKEQLKAMPEFKY